ncbi:MAG TPA: uroporphyrinogen decarboxylase family protein [Planctomycetota bacterium]|nr:uroporphyrinogen decarboxylase family protein [Planctomycetota bacterium]
MSVSTKRQLTERQQLALDTILRKPTKGIPTGAINPMEWAMIDRLAGVPEGSYEKDPRPTYRRMQEKIGACKLDQWIPENPLSMKKDGYDGKTKERTATTGLKQIVRDGLLIDSPEAAVEHLEKFAFPALVKGAAEFDEDAVVREMLEGEANRQAEMGPEILKAPYMELARFPTFAYSAYGYENYFMAYALYPEVMARHFKLQADLALKRNRAGARAIREGGLPPYLRLDHDMADGRSTLVDIKSLDEIWFPEFARCIRPFVDADVALVWHCDGNLMDMVPRLLDCGLQGFQGFQYEFGMDYEKICKMKSRDGRSLVIVGGVSVTQTLPHGTPDDVKKQLRWLVDNGPKTGLFLAASSSIAPGVPWENLQALVEGFKYYREHGRNS